MGSKPEDILLQLANVRFKKNNGSLYLSNKRVGWMMDNVDTFEINIPYTDIRNQKISPEAKAKVQLQLVLFSQVNHTFHFTNPAGKETQVSERDKVKEKLAQLILQNKRKPPDELMEKKRVLEENPHLKELYMALVKTEILSSDDFWKEIAAQYKEALPPNLDVGISGAFLADIKPQTDGSNGRVLYNLTPDVMCSIFKTYPAVKRKHEEYVPHRMTESEFWTRFFQSHYYSVHTTSRSENVFSECAKYDDKEWSRDLNSIVDEPLLAVGDLYESGPLALDARDLRPNGVKAAGSNHIHATMIKRFNQHSVNILKSQTVSEKERLTDEMLARQHAQSGSQPTTLDNIKPLEVPELNLHKDKKIRLDEKLTYDDLEADSSKASVNATRLEIHDRSRYLAGPTPDLIVGGLTPDQLPSLHQSLANSVRTWSGDLSLGAQKPTYSRHSSNQSSSYSSHALGLGGPLGSSSPVSGHAMAWTVLHRVSDEARKNKTAASGGAGGSGLSLPKDLHSELAKVYSSAGELLRHFWGCFPPRTPALQEKLRRMHRTLASYHQTTVKQFQEMAMREYNRKSNILEHLEDMFQIANNKYENWNARLAGR